MPLAGQWCNIDSIEFTIQYEIGPRMLSPYQFGEERNVDYGNP